MGEFLPDTQPEARQIYINMEAGVYPDEQALRAAWTASTIRWTRCMRMRRDWRTTPEPVSRDLRQQLRRTIPRRKADALAWWKKPQAVSRRSRSGEVFPVGKGATRARRRRRWGRHLDHTASGKPVRGMISSERTAAWKRFYQEVYQRWEAGIGRHPRGSKDNPMAGDGVIVSLTPSRPGSGYQGSASIRHTEMVTNEMKDAGRAGYTRKYPWDYAEQA